jgi:hypothetical protein
MAANYGSHLEKTFENQISKVSEKRPSEYQTVRFSVVHCSNTEEFVLTLFKCRIILKIVKADF